MTERKIVIHPGMSEAPRVFKRVASTAGALGHAVEYHKCLDARHPADADQSIIHIVHSGGYICPILNSSSNVFLVAPCTNNNHAKSFFIKFWTDSKDAAQHKEWGMFFYKNLSALEQLVFHFQYWNKMRRAFQPTTPAPPPNKLTILYERDIWSEGYDWSPYTTITLQGQHDSWLYRPEEVLQQVFDTLKS